MLKQTLLLTLTICAVAFLAIRQSAYAQIHEFKLTSGDAAKTDRFGISVSISGDYAIVGATGDDDGGFLSGSAYVFVRDGQSWREQAKLTSGDAAVQDRFGISVSISGDYAIVGANGDDDGGDASGSAYIFVRDGENWTEQAKLTASDAAEFDFFGESVSISGNDAIVGANLDDDAGADAGSAYVYNGFVSRVSVEGVSVSPLYAVPGRDSVVVTIAMGGSAGLSLFAEIETADQAPLDTLPLFDDGAHHDGEVGDSLFGNAWPVPPVEERLYNVDLLVTLVDTDTVSFEFNDLGLFTTIGPYGI